MKPLLRATLLFFVVNNAVALLNIAPSQNCRFVTTLGQSISDEDRYATHWENLLLAEYQETSVELRERRSTWSRSRLENSGLSIFGASAEPESELYGEKLVRIFKKSYDRTTQRRFEDIFSRGDILIMTSQTHEPVPRECCVVDVGTDWLTVGVGASWPAGLWETRRGLPGSFKVRLDRTAPKASLHAQRKSLDLVRRSLAGKAASTLVETFCHPNSMDKDNLHSPVSEETILKALEQAKNRTSFQPNKYQEEAITWALRRPMALVRGPPGTGKTRTAALLISTAIRLRVGINSSGGTSTPRVLAVAHSNGAADVLLEALLQMGVPAIRVGRPASVSANVRHRTVNAIIDKHPEVVALRRKALDASIENHVRFTTRIELKRCFNEVQQSIYNSAPVVVTSCIGAHQLLLDTSDEKRQAPKKGREAIFPMVVIDEAAQTTEPALVCALAAAKAEQVIFVGDSRQLGPTVTSKTAELRSSLGVSPMVRLESTGLEQKTLRVQYRMPSVLLEHPSRYFYDGTVTSADDDKDLPPPPGFPWPKMEPLAFVQVGSNLEIEHEFGGKSNPTEASLVGHIAYNLLSAGKQNHSDKTVPKPLNIAVISPYSKQVQRIRAELASRNIRDDIRVGTVDSFQGQETDVVIFSAVRSNPSLELGFLRDPRRLCVAITRARRGLIILGDERVIRTSRHWAALVDFCHERGSSLDAKGITSSTNSESEENKSPTSTATASRLSATTDAEIVADFLRWTKEK